jgi:putative ABC transport system ATP-binding protein
MNDEAVLTASGLVKSYQQGDRKTPALTGVDLRLAPGEWVAVMGPSGCGKSTLLHVLGGLDRPDEGTVTIVGQSLADLNETKRALIRRRHVGYVFQAYNLLPQLDVAANVELPLRLVGVSRSAAHARSRELLAALDLQDLARAAPASLSGGEQQRVALARAIANRPAVLLADEPTGALDSAAAKAVLDLIRREHADGQAIVMATHDHRVAAAADRVVVMHDGAIVDERRLTGEPTATGFANLLAMEVW